jgi:hypothetical protein
MADSLSRHRDSVVQHRVFELLRTPEAVRIFMGYHVFAVWDYMTLLKAMQRRFTCIELPWRPAGYPGQVIRYINELVLEEESDDVGPGVPMSHFELYLKAMQELGADTGPVRRFVAGPETEELVSPVREFVDYTQELAYRGMDEEVAAAFFFGRERMVPEMLGEMIATIGEIGGHCPHFRAYLGRHLRRDQSREAIVAKAAMDLLITGDDTRQRWAQAAAVRSLELREQLWNAAAAHISRERADLPVDLERSDRSPGGGGEAESA